MANYLLCLILQRIVLPLMIIGCIALRPVGISLIYVGFIFLLPYVPVLHSKSSKKASRAFFIGLIVSSTIVTLCQSMAHILWIVEPPWTLEETFKTVARSIGFVPLRGLPFAKVLQWLTPDIIACTTSIVIFWLLEKVSKGRKGEDDKLKRVLIQRLRSKKANEQNGFELTMRRYKNLVELGKFSSILALCFAGAIQPSIMNSFYLSGFLIFSTWIAANRGLNLKFARILKLISVLLALHISAIILYQIPVVQNVFNKDNMWLRTSGLSALLPSNEDPQNDLLFDDELSMEYWLNPMILTFAYFVLSYTSIFLLDSKNFLKAKSSQDMLKEQERARMKFAEVVKKMMEKMNPEKEKTLLPKVEKKSLLDFLHRNFAKFFLRIAYIITNVFMMIWAIVYHSWFGFVLLIWSNVIWMRSDQRWVMMKTSPLLVFYGICLIVINYIYGMGFTEEELPSRSPLVNLTQIGLIKYENNAGLHIILKSFLMLSFWTTMRFMNQEKVIRRHKATLKLDETLQSVIQQKQIKRVGTLQKIWRALGKLCMLCWMWMIVLILFVMSLVGYQMTILRIINVGFSLSFILMFQLSFNLWLKTMKAFWSILIIYSMSALVLIYAYQFDEIPEFPLEGELGLEKYHKTELFLKLFPFTAVIVLAGLQLNHFHEKFLKQLKNLKKLKVDESSTDDDEKKWMKVWNKLAGAFEKLFVAVELHFYELLFIAMFWSFASKIQILNVVFMILLILGAWAKNQPFNAIVAMIISVLSIAFICGSMLYELEQAHFIKEIRSQLDLQLCEANSQGATINFRITSVSEWFGLKDKSFSNVGPYFLFLVFVTMFCGLKMWRFLRRDQFQEPTKAPTVVFEDVHRLNADHSLTNLFKFLVNYGFYKFGVEISLSLFIITIFTRMDIFAVLYIFWFPILVFRNRSKLERLWRLVTLFIAVSMIIQCLIIATFIVIKPCRGTFIQVEQELVIFLRLILKNVFDLYRNPSLMISEFILLISMTAQLKVFKAERTRDVATLFEGGGSNKLITEEAKDNNGLNMYAHTLYAFKLKIENPIDLLKRYVFEFHFWTTNAIIFVAASHQADVFSLGYIGATMTFLWHGTDFYMKPSKTIIKWLNRLLAYTVFVLILKTAIAIFGCHFGDSIPEDHCWLAVIVYVPCFNKKSASDFCKDLVKEPSYFSDGLAFIVIMIQMRIFSSYYFFNVINDTFTSTVLASRGAEMMEDLRIQEVNRLIVEEAAHLEKLKLKMEVIKQSTHALKQDKKETISHDQAIRRGGHFMFNDEADKANTPMTSDMSISTKKSVRFHFDLRSNSKVLEKDETFSEKLKKFSKKLLKEILKRMHASSRNHSYIVGVISREKKTLSESITPGMCASNVSIDHNVSLHNRKMKISTMKQLDEKLKRFTVSNVYSYDPDKLSAREFLIQCFYLLLSHTELLAYVVVCVGQISTSSVLSMPLAVMVFLWATLTFPRPSKTFWVLMIAYTQTVILIKCFSQFELCWWDKNHIYIKHFGNQQQRNFAIYELCLLIVVFFHRLILKTFGIWKSTPDFVFEDGNFHVEKSDPKTADLAIYSINNNIDDAIRFDDKEITTQSMEQLIDDDQDDKSDKTLKRHELKVDGDENNVKVKAVFTARTESLKACEMIFKDNEGNFVIKLRQDDVKLRLRKLDSSDSLKTYPVNQLVTVEAVIEEPSDFYPSAAMMSIKRHAYIFTNLINLMNSKHGGVRNRVDVYTCLFLCDFINFLVLLFGFKEFVIHPSPTDTRSLLNYIQENIIPTSLLFLLVIQFAMIIIDRMLYLKKNMKGKVIFYFFTVFYTHFWMFFILPYFTGRSLNSSTLPIVFYLIKCVYMLLSAYQIRSGYPPRVLGNFLTKKFNVVSMFAFKIFMVIPFLFELRTVIDWTFTATSLTFFEWVKVESILAQAYQIKCARLRDQNEPLRGEKMALWKKCLVGGGLTLILVCVLWFPLILFAESSALGKSNVPKEVVVHFQIGSYQKLYEEKSEIHKFTESDWTSFLSLYSKNPLATSFLSDYKAQDVVAVTLSTESSSLWIISPSKYKDLIEDVEFGQKISFRLTYKITRDNPAEIGPAFIQKKMEYELKSQETRQMLLKMLRTPDTAEPVEMENFFPKFINVQRNGKINSIPELHQTTDRRTLGRTMKPFDLSKHQSLTIQRHNETLGSWWELKELCTETFNSLPHQDCEKFLTIFMFNEKSVLSQLSGLAIKGIVGLYFFIILSGSKILRTSIFDLRTTRIFVEELPNVDKIINLCKDIFLVRESKEFSLEEDLVAKLLFLYRSPETLIQWTMQN